MALDALCGEGEDVGIVAGSAELQGTVGSAQASVMVMPTEYDSRLPRWASQAMNSCVPPPESGRSVRSTGDFTGPSAQRTASASSNSSSRRLVRHA